MSKLVIFNGQKRDPELLRTGEFSPSEKFFNTTNIGFLNLDFPLILSLLDWTSMSILVDLILNKHGSNRFP